jgi:phenylpyruvate tautomerase PptA (4-oxalocrotonate tautomerase family)
MPMIDVYAAANTFAEPEKLAQSLAVTLMEIEGVPAIPMFRNNTAAFVHTPEAMSNVAGEGNYVRVQVLTNAGALDRKKQVAVVERFTELVAAAGGDEELKQRTWVLLTEAYDGGWGLWGHAHTNEELIAAARAEIGRLQQEAPVRGNA